MTVGGLQLQEMAEASGNYKLREVENEGQVHTVTS